MFYFLFMSHGAALRAADSCMGFLIPTAAFVWTDCFYGLGRSRVPQGPLALTLKLLPQGGWCHICSHSVCGNKFYGYSGQWSWRSGLAARTHCRSSDRGLWCAVFLGRETVGDMVYAEEAGSQHLVSVRVRGKSACHHHCGLGNQS